jgi:hypothetical protein
MRWSGSIGPYDDLFHLQRISSTFADCPWPPLYDGMMRGIFAVVGMRGIVWVAPIVFSLFAAFIAWRVSVTSGLVLALTPYLITVSRTGALDHHWIEPMLVALLLFASVRRNMWLLTLALVAALFVQTALLVACGLAFIVIFVRDDEPGWAARGFAIASLAIVLYRVTQHSPDNAWYLGWPHAAMLTGAAVALALRQSQSQRGAGVSPARGPSKTLVILMIGALVALIVPSTAWAFLEGVHFFGGEPWLATIAEFQPLFRHPPTLGDDLANLGLGAPMLFVAPPPLAIFGIPYLLLAITNRRFLVPATTLFALALGPLAPRRGERAAGLRGADAFDATVRSVPHPAASRRPSPRAAGPGYVLAIAATLPLLLFDLFATPAPRDDVPRLIAAEVKPLPEGRVLAPWWLGHAIDVLGHHEPIVNNFGTMTGAARFNDAMDALRQRDPQRLASWCRAHRVRYLVLLDPARHLPSAAASAGIDPAFYRGTRLARGTAWWRLWSGERIEGFRHVTRHVWEVSYLPQP